MLDTFVVKYYFVDQLGNNNIIDNIMYEKEIINELEKSLKELILIPGLKIIIESSPARQWDIVGRTSSLAGDPLASVSSPREPSGVPVCRAK